MSGKVALSVGSGTRLKDGREYLIYGGMPSDSVYSIVQKKTSGYESYAFSLYFPRSQKKIDLDGVKVFVEKVAPDEIDLRID